MDITYSLAVHCNLSPFAIMDEDKDRVIMLINYIIEKGDKAAPAEETKITHSRRYDGFWDM